MSGLNWLSAIACLCLMSTAARSAEPTGLLAEWNFDEGKGDVAHDSSGNGHNAKIHGATWAKEGDGFVLSLDGLDDYVDCGTVPLTGPVTLEVWVRPTRKAHGEACLLGEAMQSYLLTYYNTEVSCWYIGSGSNGMHGQLRLGEWNHVVGTFDGKQMSLWINGRLSASRESKIQKYETGGLIRIGTRGRPDLPHFKGMVDKVRVYNRAISGGEVMAHFKTEVAGCGFDPAWFSRVKVTPYYYLDRGEVVVEADYRGLQPLEGQARLEVTLSNKEKPREVIQRRLIGRLPATGMVDASLSCGKLAAGDYILRVILLDGKGARPVEEFTFSYPEKPQPLVSPAERVAPGLPPRPEPTPFGFTVRNGGGFELTVKGARYAFESRVSWPNGDFNRLTAGDVPWSRGEKSWKVRVKDEGDNRWTAEAAGSFYTIQREIEVFPTHVYVKDTYTNITHEDLGLLIYNEMPVKPGQVTGSWLSGFERWGRQLELSFPDYGPNVFLTDANTGMGIIPIDDVYVVQAVPYVEREAAGVGTERFALAPGKSYTLAWAVYPTGSGDYYDFINNFRTVEDRIGTVEGAPGFIGRRSVPDQVPIDRLRMKVAIIPSISNALDDPKLYIEGIEFMDFPKEMQFLKEQAAATRKKFPGLKVVFHIAHSLYCTNQPGRFADSRVITAAGKQASWGDGSIFGKERQAANWRWWIFYPTPGNSFHNAMMKSVDVMMDEMGMDGGFMDGFLAGYQGQWTYDGRWDGHSAEIDLQTKTIKRKIGSVLLLSQPSMIEYARKIRDKGGVVIANNAVFTRSIANEKYITFNCECASGPQQHLAPNVIALARAWGPSLNSEKDVYLDMLDKLRWGELWFSYGEPWQRFSDPTAMTLAAKQFPMTFEEIRSGLVRGKERIVTMNSGVYGWPGDRSLHVVYQFDARGAPVSHDFITTVDKASVRTELRFDENESAVIEPIAAVLETGAPVNSRVIRYDAGSFRILLNGRGQVVLRVRSGAFPVKARAAYRVAAGGAMTVIAEKDATLSIPLRLEGLVEVVIARADGGRSQSRD